MYVDCREVDEARNGEIKAWAYVWSLITSLEGQNLESRLKASIEAKAKSQKRLAAAEAEIGDLRQKLEASKRFVLHRASICFVSSIIFFYFLVLIN